jgi:hypothetical protein
VRLTEVYPVLFPTKVSDWAFNVVHDNMQINKTIRLTFRKLETIS